MEPKPRHIVIDRPGAGLDWLEGRDAVVARSPKIHAHVPISWTAIGEEDPRTRLISSIQFLGTYFNIEAIEVGYVDSDGIWLPVCDTGIRKLESLEGAYCQFATGFERTEIEGRQYVVIMTPFTS